MDCSRNSLSYSVANIVAFTEIGAKLNLNKLVREIESSEYVPEVYFALIYRLTKPKLSILVNKSGKIIFTGAKSFTDIELARNIFFEKLEWMGYQPKKNQIFIENLVISTNIGKKIKMENLVIEHLSNSETKIEYEPESFPGLIIKNKSPKFTALLFKSGKLLVVGLKGFEMIEPAVDTIRDLVYN